MRGTSELRICLFNNSQLSNGIGRLTASQLRHKYSFGGLRFGAQP